jgi:hypothetical protein
MSLVLINGFDDQMHGATGFTAPPSLSYNTTTPGGRTGTTSLQGTNVGGSAGTSYNAVAIPGGGDATVILGLAAQWNVSSGTVEFKFLGVLTAYRGSIFSGTVLGSATLTGAPLLASTWTFWEFKIVLSDTVGEVHVRNNGVAVLDLTGVDTKNAGTGTKIEAVSVPQGIVSPTVVYTDDWYIVTGTGAPNDFLGDCKVSTLYPDGNGDYSQMLGSDTDQINNYALVNEAGAPVTTSYVESNTVGQRDFYTVQDLTGIAATATVLGVQVTGYCNNPDGGSGRTAKLGVRQGVSEALSAAQALTAATFLPVRGVFTVDPGTGVAWNQAGVNSAQAGIEVA